MVSAPNFYHVYNHIKTLNAKVTVVVKTHGVFLKQRNMSKLITSQHTSIQKIVWPPFIFTCLAIDIDKQTLHVQHLVFMIWYSWDFFMCSEFKIQFILFYILLKWNAALDNLKPGGNCSWKCQMKNGECWPVFWRTLFENLKKSFWNKH